MPCKWLPWRIADATLPGSNSISFQNLVNNLTLDIPWAFLLPLRQLHACGKQMGNAAVTQMPGRWWLLSESCIVLMGNIWNALLFLIGVCENIILTWGCCVSGSLCCPFYSALYNTLVMIAMSSSSIPNRLTVFLFGDKKGWSFFDKCIIIIQ